MNNDSKQELAEDVRWLLESYNSYFELSDEEIRNYVSLATKGADLPDEEAIEHIAHLAAAAQDGAVYWAAVQCQWGYVNRNSINNDEDVDRKNRIINIFRSICPKREQFGNMKLHYSELVKTVLEMKDVLAASILAFGLYHEMDSDYMFWEDLAISVGYINRDKTKRKNA